MSQLGVEAPAVTPTFFTFFKSAGFISAGVSIRKLFAHCSWQTANNLTLLDEWRPPMT
jgi:hypothetical protein